MAKRLLKMPMSKLIEMIVSILLNKFDCFIVIEGGTGIGKSSLALWVARKVRRVFSRLFAFDEETVMHYYNLVKADKGVSLEEFVETLVEMKEKRAYNFNMRHDLIYTQKEMQKGLSSWNRICIPDEMINITFNRDFYSEDQKNIIKMVNMYRDHCNLILACVPQFQVLDNQIKNLTKIRLSVVRRGVAILQTPNKTIYGRDKWDSATNEKIEREWLQKGVKNPAYARLTTVRSIVRFSALPKAYEKKYQAIKDKKRTVILKKEMGLSSDDEKETALQKTVKMLTDGKIRNAQVLQGLAISEGVSEDTIRRRIINELKKQGKDHRIASYYWDKKAKKGDDEGIF